MEKFLPTPLGTAQTVPLYRNILKIVVPQFLGSYFEVLVFADTNLILLTGNELLVGFVYFPAQLRADHIITLLEGYTIVANFVSEDFTPRESADALQLLKLEIAPGPDSIFL